MGMGLFDMGPSVDFEKKVKRKGQYNVLVVLFVVQYDW